MTSPVDEMDVNNNRMALVHLSKSIAQEAEIHQRASYPYAPASTVGLLRIEGSFGSGQTPRACELISPDCVFPRVHSSTADPGKFTACRKLSWCAGRLQKTVDFQPF